MNSGSRLGPYELHSRIGAGGMGEVWRATDTRLGRAVAVKILPAELGANAQFRARFEREARTVSQLNHPNICTLFDVGENYLVMELLEGESLADRIARGPIPISDVVRWGAQIADALDRAHRQGVVHRDLKPGNVMITKSGAKLLDFGLARTAVLNVSVDGATEHRPLTQEGTILGTFQYMSPEQLEGSDVDHRSDIFSFGAVMYEIATGRRAFEGKTKTSLIAAIVGADPIPLAQVQPMTPPALDHVIRKSLAKDPEARWQSAHDVAEELRWIAESGSQAGVAAIAPSSRRIPKAWVLVAAAVGWIVAALAGIAAWRTSQRLEVAQRPLRMQIMPPDGTRVSPTTNGVAALSPDGTTLLFLGSRDNRWFLHLRDLATGATRLLEGTGGSNHPFWSPDSSSIGFFADGKLKTVRASGGGVQELAPAPAGRGGAWSPEGVIVFAPDIDAALMRISTSGGPASPLTKQDRPSETHRNPYFLPDGKRFLYTVRDDTMTAARLMAGSLDGSLSKRVLDKGSNVAVYGGYLLYFRSGNLVAQPFDEKTLTVSGSPQPVVEDIEYFNARDIANFSVAANGFLVYRSNLARLAQPMWYEADGRVIGPAAPKGLYRGVRISRDGKRLILERSDESGAEDIWITDVVRGTSARVTFAEAGLVNACLSRDGSTLAVAISYAGKPASVWTQAVDGSGPQHELYRGSETFNVHDWTPDGTSLLVTTQRNATGFDVAIMDTTTGTYRHILNTRYDESGPAVSPDGRWLAYNSNQSGRAEVYVTSFPEPRGRWQVSVDGGSAPVWSSDGRQIFFGSSGAQFGAPGSLYAATVRAAGTSIDFDPPRKLSSDIENAFTRTIAPDGRMVIVQGQPATIPFQLVTNWTRTLTR